jgi:glycosyltransferase involved in cell wall biosynthesis
VRVHLVDPSAFTPPYDHALCAALAARGHDVVLETSHFPFADVPQGEGYEVREHFYRWQPGPSGSRRRIAAKLAQHVPAMRAMARRARREHADVVHVQWAAVQYLDPFLLPRDRPVVLTAHDVLPREPRLGQAGAQRRLYHRADAVVVHSAHSRDRLVEETGVDPSTVHLIPHGAFTHLAPHLETTPPAALPAELAQAGRGGSPVVLFFGLIRPYKGLDVLLEAWDRVVRSGDAKGAELWIAGMPRMPMGALHRAAQAAGAVRWVERFVSDAEAAALLARADLVVLPYREIEQSGVLYSALGLGRPLLLSAVGGFPEVAAQGAAALVPPGDPSALAQELVRLLSDDAERDRLGLGAARVARDRYSWETVAAAHEELYRSLASTD